MSIFVLSLDFWLDGCIGNITWCNISVPFCLNYWSYHRQLCHNCWTRDLLSVHPLTCRLPLEKCLPFINPYFFSVRKIIESSTRFLSVTLMVFGCIGMKHSVSWSCLMSFIAACFAASPNLAMHCLRLYVITCWVAWIIGASQTCNTIVASSCTSASVFDNLSNVIYWL